MARTSAALAVIVALLGATLIAACGSGDSDDDDSATRTPSASATASRSGTPRAVSPAAATPEPELSSTPSASTPGATLVPGSTRITGGPPAATPPPPAPTVAPPPAPVGRTYSFGEAQALTQSAVIGTGDAGAGWTVLSDTISDNATAAANDPRSGASFERCGRLTGRLLTLQAPADQVVARYLGGQAVSFFTLLTVYSTAAGATDCAIESAVRFSEPGELAKQFASIFVDVSAVVVTPVTYPAVADGSFASTLKGKFNANGNIVDLTILIVAFRKGNVTAVVGSAAAGAPSTAELAPHVDRVIQRITAAQ